MTNKITVAAAEVRVGDHIYDGAGSNAHPTFAWETVTEVKQVDGLIVLVAGRLEPPHCDFWFEPDEPVSVLRYPTEQTDGPAARGARNRGGAKSP